MSDILVDARWLEPPEPMERVLAALQIRRQGQRVRLLLHREPYPLYAILSERGLSYAVEPKPDGCYEILIYEPDAASA